MLYEQQVTAGSPLQLNVPGRFFLLDSTGSESSVTLELLRGGTPIVGRVPGARRGLKIGIDGGFDGVRIESAATTIVRFFATFENVSISTTDGAEVSVPNGIKVTNSEVEPVPVVHTGTVNLIATNVGVLSPDDLTSPVDVSIDAGVRGQVVAEAAVGVIEREVIVKNLTASASAFRVGDASCDSMHGHELQPGEAITLNTRAAVYAWNTGAVAQSMSVLINSRV